ncbi:MAG: archaeosortase/exosortase family protein [Chloroflexota bacterium]
MRLRLWLWALGWLAVVLLAFRGRWELVVSELSKGAPDNYFNAAVLTLCLLWVYLRRRDLVSRMRSSRVTLPQAVLGLAMVGAALFLPQTARFTVLGLLLCGLGLFIALFGRAAAIPGMALAVLAVTLLIPWAISRYIRGPFALAPVLALVPLLSALGIPALHEGMVVGVVGPSGDWVYAGINVGCAGHTALGIMAGLFLLMMLDAPLSPRRAVPMLLLALAGAWLQNLLRLVILFSAGHLWGEAALWSFHSYLSYILLPAWYALFAFIELRVSPRGSVLGRASGVARPNLGQGAVEGGLA